MNFLNGDLDQVFTVLYEMGKIEPLLEKDWKQLYQQNHEKWAEVNSVITSINRLNSKADIRNYLEILPPQMIEALVVEVARELAAFYDKDKTIQ